MDRVDDLNNLRRFIKLKLDTMEKELEQIRLLQEMLESGEMEFSDPLVERCVAQLMRWDRLI